MPDLQPPEAADGPKDDAVSSGPTRPSLLFLAHRTPHPPDKGDRIRTYHLLRALSGRAKVDLACLADEPVSEKSVEALRGLCRRVAIVPVEPLRRWGRAAWSLARGGTASEGAFSHPGLRRIVHEWASGTDYRSALASASSLAPYLGDPALKGAIKVVDLVDVDSQKWLDYAASERGPRAWIHRLEGLRLRDRERSIPDWGSVSLVSDAEERLYRTIRADGPAFAATNGVDLDQFFPRPEPDGAVPGCVFVGALDYRPNVEGIAWFCRTAWPALRRVRPDATLALVGRKPSKEVIAMGDLPGVTVVGQVPDVRDHVARALVVIAPLQLARGVQNKVLEAMAMAKAVVTSPEALEGIAARPGEHLEVARSPEEWASTLAALLDDRPRRLRLGAEARRFVEVHHRWDTCLNPLVERLTLGSEAAR